MRIASLVLVVSLLATLGLVACLAPVELATPSPATPTPAPGWGIWTPPPTLPPITPPPGAAPASTVTKEYDCASTARDTFDFKAGDIVVFTVTGEGLCRFIRISMDETDSRLPALAGYGQGYVTLDLMSAGGKATGKYSFKARIDGNYTLTVQAISASGDPPAEAKATVTIDIYR